MNIFGFVVLAAMAIAANKEASTWCWQVKYFRAVCPEEAPTRQWRTWFFTAVTTMVVAVGALFI